MLVYFCAIFELNTTIYADVFYWLTISDLQVYILAGWQNVVLVYAGAHSEPVQVEPEVCEILIDH
jgi:hypothetical protein